MLDFLVTLLLSMLFSFVQLFSFILLFCVVFLNWFSVLSVVQILRYKILFDDQISEMSFIVDVLEVF